MQRRRTSKRTALPSEKRKTNSSQRRRRKRKVRSARCGKDLNAVAKRAKKVRSNLQRAKKGRSSLQRALCVKNLNAAAERVKKSKQKQERKTPTKPLTNRPQILTPQLLRLLMTRRRSQANRASLPPPLSTLQRLKEVVQTSPSESFCTAQPKSFQK